MNDIFIQDFNDVFQSKEIQAESLISDDHLSIEYYHLYKKNSLYVDAGSNEYDSSLYYLVLKGSIEFVFENEKMKLFKNQIIEIKNKRSFDVYALEDTTLLFISSIASNIDKKLDELATQIKQEEKRDPDTQGHNHRVGKYANIIMHHLDPNYSSNDLVFAGSYHDIGKSKINLEVLHKRGRLTADEWDEIRKHPIYTYEILKPILGEKIAFIAKCHHEKLDGSGYPDGLKGKQIPFESQILAVADVFDALTSKRAYHNSLSALEVIGILKKDVLAGKLNGSVVQALEELIGLGIIDPTAEIE